MSPPESKAQSDVPGPPNTSQQDPLMIPWLKRNEWKLIFAIAALSFVLGALGIHQQQLAVGKPLTWGDAVYFSLRLFTFSYDQQGEGTPYATVSPLLEVARFLAPAAVFSAALKGFVFGVSRQLNVWRLRRWRGHALVCGAGKRGRFVALNLRLEGHQVVVLEKDLANEAIGELRAAGVRVIVGSATDPVCQEQARMGTAALVVAVTTGEETNLEVALAASCRDNGLPVEIRAHASRRFAEEFERQPPFDRIRQRVHARFFDHEAASARILLQEFATELVAVLAPTARSPRLLLAGDGTLLPELLSVASVQCQYAFAGVPTLVVATTEGDMVRHRFPSQHPQLGQVAEVNLVEITRPTLMRLELDTLAGGADFDLTFVACHHDVDTLCLARHLAQQQTGRAGSLVACLRPSSNVMRLLAAKQPITGVKMRDLVELGCRADVLLHNKLDSKAKTIHEDYVAKAVADGASEATNPVLVRWEDLPESLRQANRAQADHQPIKLRTLTVSQTPETVEALAEAEHRRWMAERMLAGWRYGEQRDDARKRHPSLKPYVELSEAEKQKDRDTIEAVLRTMLLP